MVKFRTIVAIVALAAVVASPVLAGFAPCCCTRPTSVEKICCKSAADRVIPAIVGEHACCEKKLQALPVSHSDASVCKNVASPGLQRGTCCCVKSAPATVTVRETRIAVDDHQVAVPHLAVLGNVGPATGLRNDALHRVALPSGPPLLALYCIWLN